MSNSLFFKRKLKRALKTSFRTTKFSASFHALLTLWFDFLILIVIKHEIMNELSFRGFKLK